MVKRLLGKDEGLSVSLQYPGKGGHSGNARAAAEGPVGPRDSPASQSSQSGELQGQ